MKIAFCFLIVFVCLVSFSESWKGGSVATAVTAEEWEDYKVTISYFDAGF